MMSLLQFAAGRGFCTLFSTAQGGTDINMETTQKHQPFYGWIIVGCCMIMAGAGIGIASNCASVFIKPVSEALGVSRGQFSLYATFSSVSTMIMAPFIGGFFEKYPFKRLVIIGCCAGAGTLMLYSFATSLWQFYAIAIINGTLIGLMNGIPIALLLSAGLSISAVLPPASPTRVRELPPPSWFPSSTASSSPRAGAADTAPSPSFLSV